MILHEYLQLKKLFQYVTYSYFNKICGVLFIYFFLVAHFIFCLKDIILNLYSEPRMKIVPSVQLHKVAYPIT